MRATIEAGLPEPPGGGSVEAVDVYDDFHRRALGFIEPDRVKPLRVVVDGGNGMAGPMVGPLLERLGLDLVTTYWVPDGEFPDHEPNPLLPENRRFIVDKVLEERANLGIAWDGDADRCFFIDDRGQFVDGDFLTALLAQQLLRKEPGAMILYDVRASRAVPDTVRELGGVSHVNRVGHAFFKIAMRERAAAFGGEVSGHYYFRDFWCADSGTIPALLVLELLSVEDRPLSELVERVSRALLHLRRDQLRGSRSAGQDAGAGGAPRGREVSWLDGVSVDYPQWHFNVRPSNTEPLLRLNLESLVSPEDMEQKRDRGAGPDPVVTPEEALEGAAKAGIHRLQIPTPFAVGRVNCYLIEDEPLTLVDTGPNSGKSLDELERQLAALGRSLEEIELVVLTHQHIDHLGLVEIIVSRSGAEVAAIDVVAPFIENFGDDVERDDQFAASLMLRHGIPEDVVTALRSVSRSFRAWGARAKVTRPLHDAEELQLRDRALEVQHRPGHSPSDTLFWDAERRILLCADHLIAHISSNPLISRPLDGSNERPTGADDLPRVAAPDQGAAGADPAAGTRRAHRRPSRADRRALRAPPPPSGEDLRPDR